MYGGARWARQPPGGGGQHFTDGTGDDAGGINQPANVSATIEGSISTPKVPPSVLSEETKGHCGSTRRAMPLTEL
eukprot:6190987-Pleurochrysis_carterae.AAC.1